jgi:hypothetical protein
MQGFISKMFTCQQTEFCKFNLQVLVPECKPRSVGNSQPLAVMG